MTGLREQKKLETRAALFRAAMALFAERGYDAVSIAEIAAAANVSKMTVFNYYPTKEDLVFAPMEEHIDEFADVVRARPAGTGVVAALRAHFLDQLAAFEPATGLTDVPHVIASQRLIMSTPALLPRLRASVFRSEDALADALAKDTDPLTGHLAAAQIVAARAVLMLDNHERVLALGSAAAALPGALAAAERAFDLLDRGLGTL